ncbi:MAG TPA: OmpW family outer membrane protein [Gemmatimonadales bacterium]|nr:OmpW family outer membrane protein [Gemmatimonadales bacterium]
MRRSSVSLAFALALAVPALAQAQSATPWTVRVRGIVIAPQASSKPKGLDVRSDATVEVDISRSLNQYLALEVIAATASQEVTAPTSVAPSGSLGSVNHLPPTLLLQLHPVSQGSFRPYIGVGGNVTFFYEKSGGLQDLDLSTSVGYALQGGFDVPLGGRGLFNVDAKYVNIETDVKSNGTKLFHLKINPLVIGAGFGYRF